MPRIGDIIGIKPRRCEATGKVSHDSRASAEQVLRRLGRKAAEGMVSYECYVCSGWHLGHPHKKDK